MPAEQERLKVEAREYLRYAPQDEHGPLEHGDVLLACALAELQAAQEQVRVLREAAADIVMASHQIVFDNRSRFGVSLRNLRERLAAQRTEKPSGDEGLEPIETSPLTEREPDL